MEVQLLALLLLLLFFDSQKKKERHPSFLPFPLFDFAQQLPCDLSALPCLSLSSIYDDGKEEEEPGTFQLPG